MSSVDRESGAREPDHNAGRHSPDDPAGEAGAADSAAPDVEVETQAVQRSHTSATPVPSVTGAGDPEVESDDSETDLAGKVRPVTTGLAAAETAYRPRHSLAEPSRGSGEVARGAQAAPGDAPDAATAASGASAVATVERPRESDARAVVDARHARARELEAKGEPERAIELYLEIIREDPRNAKARNNLGVLYDRAGLHELAVEQYGAARDLDPENPEILSNLGAALAALRKFDAAERELRKALRIDPNRVDVRANLGILHFKRGLYANAEAELRWVCESDTENAVAHFYRGEALNQLDRIDEALEALEQASRLQPHNSKAYYTMGIIYDKKHLPHQAASMYRKARDLTRR